MEAAAEGGDALAALDLANQIFVAGSDDEAALKWWAVAAEAGIARAQYNLGLALFARAGDAPSERAVQWLTAATAQGHVLASFALGTILAEQLHYERAERLLQFAAERGYAPAQHNLATLYQRNRGLQEWVPQARTWYRAAAPTFAPARAALAELEATVTAATPESGVHGIEWFLRQAHDNYTLQVATGRLPQALQRTLERHAKGLDAAYFLYNTDAREPYVAIVGAFAEYTDAERALASLAPELRANSPWIRRFAAMRRELSANDPKYGRESATE